MDHYSVIVQPLTPDDSIPSNKAAASLSYKIEEMKLLRSEIEMQIKEINENERNCVVAIGLVAYFACLAKISSDAAQWVL
jgi:hypothetical protein